MLDRRVSHGSRQASGNPGYAPGMTLARKVPNVERKIRHAIYFLPESSEKTINLERYFSE